MESLQFEDLKRHTNPCPGLPFAHLNLRFNPFGELTRQERATLAVVDLGDLPRFLHNERHAIQFLAHQGNGKSTHLLALHTHFSDASYTQFYPGEKPTLSLTPMSFLDSFDLLPARQRRRLYGRMRSFACTTHVDLSNELHRAGIHVRTVEVGRYAPSRLKEIFRRRIVFAQRHANQPVPALHDKTVQRLMEKHGDNIRAMESELYDIFQQLKETTLVKM